MPTAQVSGTSKATCRTHFDHEDLQHSRAGSPPPARFEKTVEGAVLHRPTVERVEQLDQHQHGEAGRARVSRLLSPRAGRRMEEVDRGQHDHASQASRSGVPIPSRSLVVGLRGARAIGSSTAGSHHAARRGVGDQVIHKIACQQRQHDSAVPMLRRGPAKSPEEDVRTRHVGRQQYAGPCGCCRRCRALAHRGTMWRSCRR